MSYQSGHRLNCCTTLPVRQQSKQGAQTSSVIRLLRYLKGTADQGIPYRCIEPFTAQPLTPRLL